MPFGTGDRVPSIKTGPAILTLMLPAAPLLVVLLTHPMSRSYQRIWFK